MFQPLSIPRTAIILFALMIAPCGVASEKEPQPATVRILTIGNSFAVDATADLSLMAEHAGKKLHLVGANLPGASLENHVRHLRVREAQPNDPEGRPYSGALVGDSADGHFSLREALQSQVWDYVTIQQASGLSHIPASYEPWAGELIAYIKTYAPGAEIVVHQTWSYREDHPFFGDGSLNQATMYARLHDAYAKLASRYHLRTIPVGSAFQNARAMACWKFEKDPAFDYEHPPAGVLPVEKGMLNIGWRRTQEGKLVLDAKHASPAGRYLGAAFFFEFLFRERLGGHGLLPEGISPAEAASLREAAHAAIVKNTVAATSKNEWPRLGLRGLKSPRSSQPKDSSLREWHLGL